MSTRNIQAAPLRPVKITKQQVDKLAIPAGNRPSSQAFLRDTELKGFAVRVTANGRKAFILEKRINGRSRRITIAPYPDCTVEQARKRAQQLLGQIAVGRDPVEEEVADKIRQVTLADTWADFQRSRKNIKRRTLLDYESMLRNHLSDWLDKPITSIKKDMVTRRHEKIGTEKSPSSANLTMRVLRVLLNFAMDQYELPNGDSLLAQNPVDRLTRTRSWYKTPRRQTVVSASQLPAWYAAVQECKASDPKGFAGTVADYLTLILYTGLRKNEAATLKWEHVNLQERFLTIPQTKNGDPLTLPLPSQVFALLSERFENSEGDYVFPGRLAASHLIETKFQQKFITEISGVSFTIHDLRRTFVTMAESMEISMYAIKRLVNHRSTPIDVTAGYVVMTIDRLRSPMQRIADTIENAIRSGSRVVPISTKASRL